MERLTDRKTAEDLKKNVETLLAADMVVSIEHLRYIKLAEYEDEEERRQLITRVNENDENYND